MLLPDLSRAKRFLKETPPPGPLVQCGITGAHLYGFPSPDSDVDLKGVHFSPIEQLLGLNPPPETHDVLRPFEDVEHDLTTHECAMALRLLLRGNGNMLERLLSPFQLVEGRIAEDLAGLARGSISKVFASHYRGFFRGIRREHENRRRKKTMLYSYRVALSGTHLMRSGELECDLRKLAPAYDFPLAMDLIREKETGDEHGTFEVDADSRYIEDWPRLEALLEESILRSELPSAPPNREEMTRWLVSARIRYVKQAKLPKVVSIGKPPTKTRRSKPPESE